MTESAADRSGRVRAARAVGLEVTRARYIRTLDRLRRSGRASRAAALFTPLDGVVSARARRTVEVASADARLVLGKLWTAGERYRRMLEAVDRDPDRVDPGAGRSPAAVADLRRRLSDVPGRFDAGEYRAVAETLAAARTTIRALLEARVDDCEAFVGVDPERLETVAETAAEALRTEHRHRSGAQSRRRGEPPAEAGGDHRTPVGTPDRIRPEALDPENVDPGLHLPPVDGDGGESEDSEDSEDDEDTEEPVVSDDQTRTTGPGAETERDEQTAEEIVGASFDIRGDESDRSAGADDATSADGETDADTGETDDRGEDADDDHGGFRFDAVEDGTEDESGRG